MPKFESIDRNTNLSKTRVAAPQRRGIDDDHDEDGQCACLPPPEDASKRVSGKSYGCGPDCLNRHIQKECDERCCAMQAAGFTSKCENRNFTTADWNHEERTCVEPFRTELKGWGLRTTKNVAAGQFLIEYVGEIITAQQCKERIDRANALQAERLAVARQRTKQMQLELIQLEQRTAALLKQQAEEEKSRRRLKKQSNNSKSNQQQKDDEKSRTDIAPIHVGRTTGRKRRRTDEAVEEQIDCSSASSSVADARDNEIAANNKSQKRRQADIAKLIEGSKEANYYFLTVTENVIIDACKKGSVARFLNHSCAVSTCVEIFCCKT